MRSDSIQGVSLHVSFSWVLAGRVVYAASQWGILVVLAKLGSPEVVGRFGLALAITAPVFALLNLNLRVLLATDTSDEYGMEAYQGLRLLTIALALIIVSGIAFGTGYQPETAWVILAVGLAKSFESASGLLFGLIQKYERMDYIARSNMLKGTVSLVCMGVLYYLTDSLAWGAFGLAVVWAGVLLLYDLRNAVRLSKPDGGLKPCFRFSTLGKLAWLAAPLGVTTVLTSLGTNIPRYFIEYYHNQTMLGYFAAMVYLMVAGDTVLTALRQASIPRLSRCYDTSRSAFTKLLLQLVGVGVVIGTGGVLVAALFGRELLTVFYDSSYAEYVNVFVQIMVAGTVRHVLGFVSSALVVMRLLRTQAIIRAASTGFGLVVAWLLIPTYGQIGAVWSILATACANLLFGGLVVFRKGLAKE